MYLNKNLFFIITYFTIISSSFSQSNTHKVDKIINRFYTTESPGISILIAKDGKKMYTNFLGNADLKKKTQVTDKTVFQIGSITKQFTAVAILILEEQGKLKLTDTINKYLPIYPLKGNPVTIHNLLNHTSGIRGRTPISEPNLREKNLTVDETIAYFKDFPIKFKAGEKFSYSNAGYILLGKIIEIVSGVTYQKFIRENIFQKLSMNNTRFGSKSNPSRNLSVGYQYLNKKYLVAPTISISTQYSAGSILSTVSDLLKWQNALTSNTIIKKTSYIKATNGSILKNGKQISYGYGWYKRKIDDSTVLTHGGATAGFMSNGIYLKKENIYIIALTNCYCKSKINLQKLTYKIAQLFTVKNNINNNSHLKLNKWTGSYKLNNNTIISFQLIDGILYGFNDRKPEIKHKLITVSKNEFTFENRKFNFYFNNSKNGTKTVKMSSGKRVLFGKFINNIE